MKCSPIHLVQKTIYIVWWITKLWKQVLSHFFIIYFIHHGYFICNLKILELNNHSSKSLSYSTQKLYCCIIIIIFLDELGEWQNRLFYSLKCNIDNYTIRLTMSLNNSYNSTLKSHTSSVVYIRILKKSLNYIQEYKIIWLAVFFQNSEKINENYTLIMYSFSSLFIEMRET